MKNDKPMSAKEWMNENAQGVIDHSGGWYWSMDAFAAYRVREFAERAIDLIDSVLEKDFPYTCKGFREALRALAEKE